MSTHTGWCAECLKGGKNGLIFLCDAKATHIARTQNIRVMRTYQVHKFQTYVRIPN